METGTSGPLNLESARAALYPNEKRDGRANRRVVSEVCKGVGRESLPGLCSREPTARDDSPGGLTCSRRQGQKADVRRGVAVAAAINSLG